MPRFVRYLAPLVLFLALAGLLYKGLSLDPRKVPSPQIVDFMVARYGDFVLYSPPVKPSTYVLWYGPFALLLLGIVFLIKTVRQRGKQASEQIR